MARPSSSCLAESRGPEMDEDPPLTSACHSSFDLPGKKKVVQDLLMLPD